MAATTAPDLHHVLGHYLSLFVIFFSYMVSLANLGKNNKMMSPTYFGLLAEFGSAEIPLDKVCEKYFGLSVAKAKRRASLQQLPIPAYRIGSQKSPWLISAADLANHIDLQRQSAASQWEAMN